jgi:hypothetical protein
LPGWIRKPLRKSWQRTFFLLCQKLENVKLFILWKSGDDVYDVWFHFKHKFHSTSVSLSAKTILHFSFKKQLHFSFNLIIYCGFFPSRNLFFFAYKKVLPRFQRNDVKLKIKYFVPRMHLESFQRNRNFLHFR